MAHETTAPCMLSKQKERKIAMSARMVSGPAGYICIYIYIICLYSVYFQYVYRVCIYILYVYMFIQGTIFLWFFLLVFYSIIFVFAVFLLLECWAYMVMWIIPALHVQQFRVDLVERMGCSNEMGTHHLIWDGESELVKVDFVHFPFLNEDDSNIRNQHQHRWRFHASRSDFFHQPSHPLGMVSASTGHIPRQVICLIIQQMRQPHDI